MSIDISDFDTDRLEKWMENHPKLLEEHREAVTHLVMAACADQLEGLSDNLGQMKNEIDEELRIIDEDLNHEKK